VDDQRCYWDRAAARKTFTHPMRVDWLAQSIDRGARILDYGCGYGRTLDDLASLGYTNMVGVDFAPQMIERGRRSFPGLDLRVVHALPLLEADSSFDAVLLLAVLTCIPDDQEQVRLISELRRVLRPGGVLYISDMPLQSDDRNLARYTKAMPSFGTYGVFETEDGAVVRHHDDQRIDTLLLGFEKVAADKIQLKTMNGHAATAVQILARRPLR
jgi:SAM-dependent methyltransferase